MGLSEFIKMVQEEMIKILKERERQKTLPTVLKRVTVIEPNTEGYLKECLSQYKQEKLKTK